MTNSSKIRLSILDKRRNDVAGVAECAGRSKMPNSIVDIDRRRRAGGRLSDKVEDAVVLKVG